MKAAILGFGTVGSGVYEVLRDNADIIAKRVGEPLTVKYVLDLREFPGNPVMDVLTHSIDDIVNDPEVLVVAEVMGGSEPAHTFVARCLEQGKAVCTSNKEMVSKFGAELLELAKQHNTSFLFEASVGGGIPLIRTITEGLTADDIVEIRGIVNGTTNYILTRMRDAGLEFETALKEAQDLGYAERNPAADIEGIDAQRKTSILASLATGKHVCSENIYTEGITKITATDIAYAKALDANIRLVSLTRKTPDGTFALVAPFMFRRDCQLYNVDGVFNAVMIRGNMVNDIMLYGSGAGKLPTASAVVSDLIEEAKTKGSHINIEWSAEKLAVASKDSLVSRYFVRVPAAEAGKAQSLFSIAETVKPGVAADEFAFVTESMTEKVFEDLASRLTIISRIRAEF